jgi:UDP-GlcNAc:undecaprenyl-phosphate/decaprenyl-phosphate GlcNAc-1-phosphate transferase
MHFEILFLLLVTYFAYHLLIRFAKDLNLIDIPNERSSHKLPTVRGFGLVIFASIGLTLLVFRPTMYLEHTFLLCSVLLIGLLGLVDDIKETPPFIKIVTLIVVCMFLYAEGFLITSLGIYLGVSLDLNLMAAILFSTGAIVIFTNAFNLIDGLDGLSGLVSIIIFLSFLFIGINNNNQLLIVIPILFISSLGVFIVYNWHPAKVFLGDSGSLMIGFVISVLGVRSLEYIEPISILYITLVPIIDVLFVYFRRIFEGNSPFQADKFHCHHIILEYFNGSVNKTVIFIAIIQLLSSVIGVLFVAKVSDSFIALLAFLIIFVLIYKFLNRIKHNLLN